MSAVKRRTKSSNALEKETLVNETSQVNRNSTTTSQINIPLKVISRSVIILSLLVIVYFSTNNENFKTFAKQSELLQGKGHVIECSSSYMKELDQYIGCIPHQCKRYVTDQVISVREADKLLEIAKKGLKFGGSSGGASILDLHSGALSQGSQFINIYKLPEAKNLFTHEDYNVYRVIKEKIKFAIAHHFGVDPEKIYLTHPIFFSQISDKKAVTIHDEYWHPHVDKETYKSFHFTTLLYLGDYKKDFRGGRFVFIDKQYNSTIEPRKARLSMFTSGEENLHYVEKVSSGVRYAMTISFTCDKKYAIEDPSANKY